ncbi:MAG: alkaline phosphatase PhoX [Pseudomonadota bacterium]
MDRRRFLQSLAAAATMPGLGASSRVAASPGTLRSDPGRIIQLPPGFSYNVVSRRGARMSDGFRVPGLHDGMAAFDDDNGRVRLVCNHECAPWEGHLSAFRDGVGEVPDALKARFYDRGEDKTPGAGCTTTTIYNPASGKTEGQFLSLAGTEINCAGGATPWGSWLSCEETFTSAGTGRSSSGVAFTREQDHGYVFEVPSAFNGLVEPRPLKAMGRFEHEACAVLNDIVYMTEDRYHSLFYRFLPDTPGDLAAGGKLQALAIRGNPSVRTHNWSATPDIEPGDKLAVEWIDIPDPDPTRNEIRLLGARKGAATFARGEGLCVAGDALAFTCTIGGRARLGQVFLYQPSEFEGTARENEAPGTLKLFSESAETSLLRNADNLVEAPWGDLLICEDTSGHCGLVGVRPDGSQYHVAFAAYVASELAGVCFSPDGETLFVNIQKSGLTLAINGDWSRLAS